jgi:hypothetical protein
MRHAPKQASRRRAALDIIFRKEARRVKAMILGRYDELTFDAVLDQHERIATPRELAALRGGR